MSRLNNRIHQRAEAKMARKKMTQFQSNLRKVDKAINLNARRKARAASNDLRNHLLVELSNAKARTGQIRKIPGTNIEYVASAPGEYPALATGQLRSSIKEVEVVQTNDGPAAVIDFESGGVAKHGGYLERGKSGPPGSGIRPWLSKAMDEKYRDMLDILRGRWF